MVHNNLRGSVVWLILGYLVVFIVFEYLIAMPSTWSDTLYMESACLWGFGTTNLVRLLTSECCRRVSFRPPTLSLWFWWKLAWRLIMGGTYNVCSSKEVLYITEPEHKHLHSAWFSTKQQHAWPVVIFCWPRDSIADASTPIGNWPHSCTTCKYFYYEVTPWLLI